VFAGDREGTMTILGSLAVAGTNHGESAIWRKLRCERGVTLVELLIAMVMALLVVGVPTFWIAAGMRQENLAASRSSSAVQAEVGLARLIHDLRQVAPSTTTTFTWTAPAGSGSASVAFTIPVAGTQGATTQSVTWSCSFGNTGTCSRQVCTISPVVCSTAVQQISNVWFVSFDPTDANGNHLASGSTTQAAYVAIQIQVLDTSQLDRTRSHQALQAVPSSTYNLKRIVLQGGVDLRSNSL
jgi:Tfp pilus assembly protein PilV